MCPTKGIAPKKTYFRVDISPQTFFRTTAGWTAFAFRPCRAGKG